MCHGMANLRTATTILKPTDDRCERRVQHARTNSYARFSVTAWSSVRRETDVIRTEAHFRDRDAASRFTNYLLSISKIYLRAPRRTPLGWSSTVETALHWSGNAQYAPIHVHDGPCARASPAGVRR